MVDAGILFRPSYAALADIHTELLPRDQEVHLERRRVGNSSRTSSLEEVHMSSVFISV